VDRYDEAGQKYLEAADWNENASTTPYNLMEAAIAFNEAGNTDRAIEIVDRVIEEYPNSLQSAEAKRMKGLLTRST
jgi:TolA-binding protein